MVAAPLQFEAAGHDAVEALIDLHQQPSQGARLVAVRSALPGGRSADLPNGSDVCLAGTQDGAQLARRRRRAWGPVAAPAREGCEWVVDAADEIGTTALEPAQQLAQRAVGRAPRGDRPWCAVSTLSRVEPFDVAQEHPAVQVRERSDRSRFAREAVEGQHPGPARLDAARRPGSQVAPERQRQRKSHVFRQAQRREIDDRAANHTRGIDAGLMRVVRRRCFGPLRQVPTDALVG